MMEGEQLSMWNVCWTYDCLFFYKSCEDATLVLKHIVVGMKCGCSVVYVFPPYIRHADFAMIVIGVGEWFPLVNWSDSIRKCTVNFPFISLGIKIELSIKYGMLKWQE